MNYNKNMVDEKFECAAVIFRLAGRQEYCHTDSDYHKEIAATFSKFAEHEAIKYVKTLVQYSAENEEEIVWYLGYDAVFKFAVHIEKKEGKFIFIEDIRSLFDDRRWNEENSGKFLELFNKFYVDTNYEAFFNSHIDLFEQSTQKFVDKVYGKIDFEWFAKYVDPSNLRCILSHSSGECEYGATVNDKIIYCLLSADLAGNALIHEYCHSFGGPLSVKWYEENPEFKKLCDESIKLEENPQYNNGLTMANEYVTRAYEILYWCQGYGNEKFTQTFRGVTYKRNEFAPICIIQDFKKGFPYIDEVYKMVLELENKK